MERLESKTYGFNEVQEFKKEVLAGRRDAVYLLQNIQAIRLLGWKLLTGSRIPTRKLNGYGDVISFTENLPDKTIKLYIEGRK